MTNFLKVNYKNIIFDSSANSYTGLGRARKDIFNYLKENNLKQKNIIYDFQIGEGVKKQFSFWDLFRLKRFKYDKNSLYVFTNLTTPSVWVFKINYVLILFDLYCFKERGVKNLILKKLMVLFMENAKSVVCSTESIKKEAKIILNKKKIIYDEIVLNSKNVFRSLNANNSKKMIFIGSNKNNKNISLLKNIASIVSVSKRLHLITLGLSKKDLGINNNKKITCLNNISDETLRILLKNSDFLICTSNDEGLCYPVLDALDFNLKVLSLDLPVFREMYSGKNITIFENEKKYLDYIKKLEAGEINEE